jgi:hypothetical protein
MPRSEREPKMLRTVAPRFTAAFLLCALASNAQAANKEGHCGLSHAARLSNAPQTGLCDAGNPSAVAGEGPWTWSCAGASGENSLCRAEVSAVALVKPLPQQLTRSPIGAVVNIGRDGPREWQENEVAEHICSDIGGLSGLRFAGGTTSDNYDWKRARLVDPKLYPFGDSGWTSDDKPGTRFTFDEFMAVAHSLNADTVITQNMLSAFRAGGGAQALLQYETLSSDWVKYARDKGYKVTYWEIANEPYWNRDVFGDKPLADVARIYAREYNKFYDAMKRADPAIKIGIVGPLAPTADAAQWWSNVMAQKVPFDFVAVHYYEWNASFNERSGADVTRYMDELRKLVGAQAEILLTEYDQFDNISHNVTPIDHALVLSELTMRLLEGGASKLFFWPLREEGHRHPILWRHGDTYSNTSTVFRLFNERLYGRLVSLATDDEDLYGIGTTYQRSAAVYLVNRGSTPKTLAVDFRRFLKGPAPGSIVANALVERKRDSDKLAEWSKETRGADVIALTTKELSSGVVGVVTPARSFFVVSAGDWPASPENICQPSMTR